MKQSLPWVIVCLFSLSLLVACDNTASRVRSADAACNRAILENDGREAIKYMSKDSITRMSQMITLARTATPAQTKALPFADKLDVLAIRLAVPVERLRSLNGYEYYVEAVDKGEVWSTVGFKRVRYTFDADRTQAKVTLQIPFTHETFDIHWILEDGTWKEDEVASGPEIGRWGRASAKEAHMSEDEFLVSLLSELLGEQVSDDAWRPKR